MPTIRKYTIKLLSILILIHTSVKAQKYWQQQVNHSIDVTLNDSSNSLTGMSVIEYINNSPDTLRYIWFHLWPNAYKNDKTAFSEQMLLNGSTEFYFSEENKRGYINQLNFSVNGKQVSVIDHPQHQDIIQLILPEALLPKQKITIQTPFHVKLPFNFSRSGYAEKTYQITQWFPKPAVYDKKGWHEMPYLDQGEFYSEFGNYSVTINVPKDYIVAATGKKNNEITNNNIKTLLFEQDNIHDFAWFADKEFEIVHDTIQLKEKTVDAYAFFNKKRKEAWSNAMQQIKEAIITKSKWLGEYPYSNVSVVEMSESNKIGGMEYPTICIIEAQKEYTSYELINHEIGHNWFYGILANNERRYPWLDEGFNTYYDNRLARSKNIFQNQKNKGNFISNRLPLKLETSILKHLYITHQDQPIETSSAEFSSINYNLIAYNKTAEWLEEIEKELGTEVFDSMMKTYYKEWKFKHPYPENFKAVAQSFLKDKTDLYFQKLYQTADLSQSRKKKQIRFSFLFNGSNAENYNTINVIPVACYNKYDNVLPGIILNNYSLPANKFKFLFTPLYGIRSKKIRGLARVSYDFYPTKKNNFITFFTSMSRFSYGEFIDSTNKKNALSFQKIVPGIRYTFHKEPLSTIEKYIQFKSYFINETTIQFFRDTLIQQDVITYPQKNRYLNQLTFVIENSRKLYPYRLQCNIEQGDAFVRSTLTANYRFNYAKGGAMDVRWFAGKFFYTAEKSNRNKFRTDRYHLNLSGPTGYEDYTYSNYFLGRSEFEGLASQQMMMRDGGFKVATNLLSDKIGKSDNWLTAINLTTDLPKQYNPLSVLPFKLPLKLFADIGTYAEAWNKNATTGKFLFDAGFQLSIGNVLNVYIPVLFSKTYKDYYKSIFNENRFSKTITFSIDVNNIKLSNYFPQIRY